MWLEPATPLLTFPIQIGKHLFVLIETKCSLLSPTSRLHRYQRQVFDWEAVLNNGLYSWVPVAQLGTPFHTKSTTHTNDIRDYVGVTPFGVYDVTEMLLAAKDAVIDIIGFSAKARTVLQSNSSCEQWTRKHKVSRGIKQEVGVYCDTCHY